MSPIKAINSKYQTLISRFIKWDREYNRLTDQAYREHDDGNERKFRSLENKASKAYEKALEAWDELPKRERKKISKYYDTQGY